MIRFTAITAAQRLASSARPLANLNRVTSARPLSLPLLRQPPTARRHSSFTSRTMPRAALRLLPAALAAAGAAASPLWDYVHSPNPAYGWYDTGIVVESTFDNITKSGGWKAHLLNLTSQAWLTPGDFVGSIGHIWTHNLVVVVPETINYKAAGMLYITGNGNDGAPNQPPSADDEDLLVCASLAVTVGAVCSVLYQVPNQPVVFAADPSGKGRSEDALVAWTWDRYASGADPRPEAIAYFAMARAGVTALDATEAFILNKTGAQIAKWGVAGASKRGATTWLVGAAAHERLFGIIPIVFDALNFKDTLQHMWQTLGNWTFAFTDYIDAGVTAHLNDGTGYLDRLAAQVDPLAYNVNLSLIPKLIVDSTGDEFFQPQDDAFWWQQLGGEKARMMVDNAEHSMATGALYLITSAETWVKAILDNVPRPVFNWTMDAVTGAITIKVYGPAQPHAVVNRMATTLDGYRRDFRLVAGDTPANPCKVGIPVPVFGSACLKPIIWIGAKVGAASYDPVAQVGTYVLTQDAPPVGWRAFLGELYFPSTIPGLSMQLTTQVSFVPAPGTPLYPFPLCVGAACRGDLV